MLAAGDRWRRDLFAEADWGAGAGSHRGTRHQ
jgi:hypothetical protein